MGNVFDDIQAGQANARTSKPSNVFDDILSSRQNKPAGGLSDMDTQSAGPQDPQEPQAVSATQPQPSKQTLSSLDAEASRNIQENEGGGRVIKTAEGRERYSEPEGLSSMEATPADNRSSWEKRDKSKDNFAQRVASPLMERNEFQYKNKEELAPEKQTEQLDYIMRDSQPSHDEKGTANYSDFVSVARRHGYSGDEIKKHLDTTEQADIPLAPTGDGFTGGLGEVGRGAARGLAMGAADVAKAGQWFTPESAKEGESTLKGFAEGIESIVERNPQLFQESLQNKDRSWYNPMKALVGGPEMVARMAPGLALPGGVAFQFWGSTAQEKYDQLTKEKPEMSEAKKMGFATAEGMVQGGLEWLQTKIPASVLGKFIPGGAKKDVLRQAAGMTKAGKGRLLGALGAAYVGELATETAQDTGSRQLDYFSGLEAEGVSLHDIGESLKHNAGPVLFTTFALGGPAHISDNNRRQKIKDTLTAGKDKVSKFDRIDAVMSVHQAVARNDKELAEAWAKEALPMAAENKPLAIPTDDKFLEQTAGTGGALISPLQESPKFLNPKGKAEDYDEATNFIINDHYGEMGEAWDALDDDLGQGAAGKAASQSIKEAMADITMDKTTTETTQGKDAIEDSPLGSTNYSETADIAADTIAENADLKDEKSKAAGVKSVESFLSDEKIPAEAKRRFVNSGILEHLGMNKEDHLQQGQNSMEDEWVSQSIAARRNNQENNKPQEKQNEEKLQDGSIAVPDQQAAGIDGKLRAQDGADKKAADGAGQTETIKNGDSVADGQEANTAPSEAQKEAGNYKKAHVKLDGLDVSIENPAGSVRSGKDQSGKEWSQKLENDYGYVKGSEGFDKDHVDVFFEKGYDGGAETIHVVNQHNKDGSFDEHKVVIGAKNSDAAMKAYNANYEKGWTGGKNVVEMPMAEFKEWVKSDDPKKGPAKVQKSGDADIAAALAEIGAAKPQNKRTVQSGKATPTLDPGYAKNNKPLAKWFGKSQMVDKKGEPQTLYHGSKTFGTKDDSGSWTFDDKNLGKNTKSPLTGLGHFFATDKVVASGYSKGTGNVQDVILRAENPKVMDSTDFPVFNTPADAQKYAKDLQAQGYDSILIKDEGHVVVFKANQVKSADKNSGEYSRKKDNILMSRKGKKDSADGRVRTSAESDGQYKRSQPTPALSDQKDQTGEYSPADIMHSKKADVKRKTFSEKAALRNKTLKDAVSEGLITKEQEGFIDEVLKLFPEAWSKHFEPRISSEKLAPTKEQLTAHKTPKKARESGTAFVAGALVGEKIGKLGTDTKHLAVMFDGLDMGTFLHEFGKFIFARALSGKTRGESDSSLVKRMYGLAKKDLRGNKAVVKQTKGDNGKDTYAVYAGKEQLSRKYDTRKEAMADKKVNLKTYNGIIKQGKQTSADRNEWFADSFKTWLMQEVVPQKAESKYFAPELTGLFRKVLQTARNVWRRLKGGGKKFSGLDPLFSSLVFNEREINEVYNYSTKQAAMAYVVGAIPNKDQILGQGFHSNSKTFTSFDPGTICPKQRDLVDFGLMNVYERTRAQQREMPDNDPSWVEIAKPSFWAKQFEEAKAFGVNVPCLYCYVEDGRRSALTKQSIGKSKYSVNFAMAKKVTESVEYVDKLVAKRKDGSYIFSQKKIDDMNKRGGLRMFSFSDYIRDLHKDSIERLLRDANERGLSVKAITKNPEFVEDFADTGIVINLSIDNESDGSMGGLPWAKAAEMKKAHPNVKIRTVAVNLENYKYFATLKDHLGVPGKFVDVITPYHGKAPEGSTWGGKPWQNMDHKTADGKALAKYIKEDPDGLGLQERTCCQMGGKCYNTTHHEQCASNCGGFSNVLHIPDIRTLPPGGSVPNLSRTGEPSTTGRTAADVQKEADKITKGWKKEAIAVESVNQLPPRLRDFVLKNDGASDAQGLFDPKTDNLYLIAGNIAQGDNLETIILHEAVGHYGFEKLLEKGGESWGAMAKSIAKLKGQNNKPIMQAARAVKETHGKLDAETEAKEIIAYLAQNRPSHSMVKRIIRAIRQALRNMGMELNITGAEIFDMIRQAEQDVKSGKKDKTSTGVGQFAVSPAMSLSEAKEEITDTPAFQKWFGDSKVTDEDGDPLVVYRGTTHDFSVFDPTITGNKEGAFGAVNYFTSDKGDADMNYAGEGPDLTQRIDLLAEQIENGYPPEHYNIDQDEMEAAQNNPEAARQLAEEQLSGGEPTTMPVFLKMENPAFVNGQTETWIDNFDDEVFREDAEQEVKDTYDATDEEIEEGDYNDEIHGIMGEMAANEEPAIFTAISDAIYETDTDADPVKVFAELELYDSEVTASYLYKALKESENLSYATDQGSGGELMSSHIIGQVFKNLGFDGIALQNADKQFNTMDMGGETTHYHIFEETPQNIKSIYNQGSFDATNPDIMMSRSGDTGKQPLFSRKAKEKEQQTISNTGNLNATKDGQTSPSSLSHGEKIINNIIRTLESASPPSVAKGYNKARIDKAIEKYNKALDASEDRQKSAAEKQKFAASFVQQLPSTPRAKLLQRLSMINRVKSEKAQQKRLDNFLEYSDEILTKHLRREIIRRMREKIKGLKKNKDGVATGRGPKFERDLKYLREIIFNMVKDEQVMVEEAGIEKASETLNTKLSAAKTDREREEIQEELDDLQSKSNLLTTFGALRTRDLATIINARDVLLPFLSGGRLEWRENQEAWRDIFQKGRNKVSQEVTGEEMPTPETQAQRQKRRNKDDFMTRAKEAVSSLTNMIQSWELSLDKIVGRSGLKTLQSWTVKHYGSLAHKATRDYERMQLDTNNLLMDKASEIFGAKKGRKLAKVFADLDIVEDKKIFLYKKDLPREAMPMSPLQAAYWYQISKGIKNPVVQRTFEAQGITEETLKQIEKMMGPKLKAWADYLVDDFYQDFHYDTNKIYKLMYGIDLTKTRNYVPLKREIVGKGVEDKKKEGMLMISNKSVKKGGVVERVDTDLSFKVSNINDVLISHVGDMNHFKAWALPSKEINGVFNDPHVRGYIEQYHGKNTRKELETFQKHFTLTPAELKEGTNRFLDNIRSSVTKAMVGANPVVFFKQLSSIPAYASDIPAAEWAKYTAMAMANPVKAAKALNTSTMMQARYKNGFERDIAHAMRRVGSDMLSGAKRASDIFMVLTALGDRSAITIGGYAVYRYHLAQNLAKKGKDKMTKQEAHDAAITEFEKSTERAQQSSHVKDMGSFQRGNSWQRLFTMFMTSPASYSRQIYLGVRNMKSDPVNSMKRLFIYGVVMPTVFQAIADAVLVDGDEEDIERMLGNQVKALVMAPFNGLPIVRTMAQGYINVFTGHGFFGDQFSPAMQTFETSKKLAGDVFKAATGGTKRIDSEEYARRAVMDAIHMVGYFKGVPTKPLSRIATGLQDAAEVDIPFIRDAEETEHPFRRSVGYSKYAVGE